MISRLLILATLLGCHFVSAADYRFSLQGENIDPRIYPVQGPRKGAYLEGDVGNINGIPFVLRQPGHYQFRVPTDGPLANAELYCRINDGAEVRVGVRVAVRPPTDGRAQAVYVNPLAKMTASEKRQLWGVALDAWQPDLADSLSGVEWQSTALAVTDATQALSLLPACPDLRYLSISPSEKCDPEHLRNLRFCTNLAYLSLSLHGEDLPLGTIANSPGLVNLDLKGASLRDVDALGQLASLRFLKLQSVAGLDTIEFVRGTPLLRVLKIDGGAVQDPGPLVDLKHLRLFSANETRLDQIPPLESLPHLRDLRLHSTPVAKRAKLIQPLRAKLNILIKNWDPAIRAFEAHDAEHPPPRKAALFIGSSSIRHWDLKSSFPGIATINRGFGGSELSDSLRYFDRIVLPYQPRAILLYAGDNDINNGESAEQVIADFQAFARKVRSGLPESHLAFIPIKPSIKRWNLWPVMKKANEAIRSDCEADARLHYLDIATPMLGKDGRPIPGLFDADNLHLNDAGYEVWNKVVGDWLQSRSGS